MLFQKQYSLSYRANDYQKNKGNPERRLLTKRNTIHKDYP